MNITRILAATAGFAVIASAQLIAFGGVASAETCTGKTFKATYNNQVIHGTCGADTIEVGRWQGVTVYAYGGDDEVKAGFNGGTTTAHLGSGHDEIWTAANSDKQVRAYGDSGNDTMVGGGKDDFLYGGLGNDTITGNLGTNHMFGEEDSDTLIAVAYAGPKLDYVSGGTGSDKATVDNGVDLFWDVEQVTKK